jgi:hypothetical protein
MPRQYVGGVPSQVVAAVSHSLNNLLDAACPGVDAVATARKVTCLCWNALVNCKERLVLRQHLLHIVRAALPSF